MDEPAPSDATGYSLGAPFVTYALTCSISSIRLLKRW